MAIRVPVELRKRIVAAYHAGDDNYETVAKRFGIGRASLNRWLRLERENGDVEPKPNPGRPPMLDKAKLDTLRDIIKKNNDATLSEVSISLNERTGVKMAVSSIHQTLGRLGITRKKKISMRANATETR